MATKKMSKMTGTKTSTKHYGKEKKHTGSMTKGGGGYC